MSGPRDQKLVSLVRKPTANELGIRLREIDQIRLDFTNVTCPTGARTFGALFLPDEAQNIFAYFIAQ